MLKQFISNNSSDNVFTFLQTITIAHTVFNGGVEVHQMRVNQTLLSSRSKSDLENAVANLVAFLPKFWTIVCIFTAELSFMVRYERNLAIIIVGHLRSQYYSS